MKIFFTILSLLLFSFLVKGQSNIFNVSNGEYYYAILRNDSLFQIDGVATFITGLPPIYGVACGAHQQGALDVSGNVYMNGDNTYGELGNGTTSPVTGWYQILTDSTGASFTGIKQLAMGGAVGAGNAYGWTSAAVKSDGTVWVWGYTGGQMRSNGTLYQGGNNTRPVKVAFPAGVVIQKLIIGNMGLALDDTGGVWTFGGNNPSNLQYCASGQGTTTPNYNSPAKISAPGEHAKDIGGGTSWNFYILTNGSAKGWGPFLGYLGIGFGNQTPYGYETPYGGSSSPALLDTAFASTMMAGGHKVDSVYVNGNGTFWLRDDSTLWFMGDGVNGCAGNGTQMNWATYTGSNGLAPWNWDQGYWEGPNYRKPIQVAPGMKFSRVFVTDALCYDIWAQDIHGNLYSWGRGKSGCLGNQIIACDNNIGGINGTYPNSFDFTYPVKLNMAALFGTTTYPSTTPICITSPSGSPCNNCTNPSPTTVGMTMTAVQYGTNAAIVTVSATTTNYISTIVLTQTSGTALQLGVQAGTGPVFVDTISNVSGTVGFQASATDTYYNTNTATANLTISSAPASYLIGRKGGKFRFF